MRKLLSHSRAGFTLIELMIAMTILGMMAIMAMTTYFQMSETSRRLQLSREISETAREITEQIAQDIKNYGLIVSTGAFDPSTTHTPWNNVYEPEGTEVLGIRTEDSVIYYTYAKRTQSGFAPCSDADKADTSVHCGLYRIIGDDRSTGYNLVDAFRERETMKRVKISDLKFYITGTDDDNTYNTPKVTLKMTLTLMPRGGVSPSLAQKTQIEVQTTFSYRFYQTQ